MIKKVARQEEPPLNNLLKELFTREGFKELPSPSVEVDFAMKSPEGFLVIAEVKVYRSRYIPLNAIETAKQKLLELQQRFDSDIGYLITNASLPNKYLLDSNNAQLNILDYDRLDARLRKYPDLHEKFSLIIRAYEIFGGPPAFIELDTNQRLANIKIPEKFHKARNSKIEFKSLNVKLKPIKRISQIKKGVNLATQLKKIPSGGKSFIAFEDKCIEIVKYLFKDDFTAWTEQQRTSNGLHRFDLIARNISKHDFWVSLQSHFRSKYVVFEFKNYEEEITQKEIFSTEKYLYTNAMRTAAIIISRKGADGNALAAARGALREHGKIILNFSVEEICLMLERSDLGEVASDEMANRLDKMLMTIER